MILYAYFLYVPKNQRPHFHFIHNSQIACDLFCLKFVCERSQCGFDLFAMFDSLRTFACEVMSRIEGNQRIRQQLLETKRQRGQALSKRNRFHWMDKQLKFVRTTLKCVLNSHTFGIRNSQIASVLRMKSKWA